MKYFSIEPISKPHLNTLLQKIIKQARLINPSKHALRLSYLVANLLKPDLSQPKSLSTWSLDGIIEGDIMSGKGSGFTHMTTTGDAATNYNSSSSDISSTNSWSASRVDTGNSAIPSAGENVALGPKSQY